MVAEVDGGDVGAAGLERKPNVQGINNAKASNSNASRTTSTSSNSNASTTSSSHKSPNKSQKDSNNSPLKDKTASESEPKEKEEEAVIITNCTFEPEGKEDDDDHLVNSKQIFLRDKRKCTVSL